MKNSFFSDVGSHRIGTPLASSQVSTDEPAATFVPPRREQNALPSSTSRRPNSACWEREVYWVWLVVGFSANSRIFGR
ncbi:hypothetical protein SESBI_15500 [Sesbania bispinosa]|nr:hypothetical protein SESBI_15500 [Sesbania bispinosa]